MLQKILTFNKNWTTGPKIYSLKFSHEHLNRFKPAMLEFSAGERNTSTENKVLFTSQEF